MGIHGGFNHLKYSITVTWWGFQEDFTDLITIYSDFLWIISWWFLMVIFPESVWAQGSSNSGGLWNIFSSSHPHMFTSSHLHIFSSSHPHIFTSSHPHILTSSHPHILPSCSLALLLSCPLALLLLDSLLKARGNANETARNATLSHEMTFDRQRTKWRSIAKNWGKIASCNVSGATLSHKMRFDRQKLR